MMSLDEHTRAEIVALASQLSTRAALTPGERERIREPFMKRVYAQMLRSGGTYGQARGSRGVPSASADEASFKAAVRAIDNHIVAQVRIVRGGVEDYFDHGEYPAPYYAFRIGVILRKMKECALEAEFLEAYARHCAGGNGARYRNIAERANKARALATKGARS